MANYLKIEHSQALGVETILFNYFFVVEIIHSGCRTHGNDGNDEGNEMCDCVTWPVFFIWFV